MRLLAKQSRVKWDVRDVKQMREKVKRQRKVEGSSYSQTSEQTHGFSLQGVGRTPRGLSRHEMVLHVMTSAGQPGQPGSKELQIIAAQIISVVWTVKVFR